MAVGMSSQGDELLEVHPIPKVTFQRETQQFVFSQNQSLVPFFYCGGTPTHGAQCELCYLFRRAYRECSARYVSCCMSAIIRSLMTKIPVYSMPHVLNAQCTSV